MKIIKILLIGIFSTVLSTNININEIPIAEQDMLVTSSDFKEVSALEPDMLEGLQEFGASQGIEEIPERVDYEKAVKVYIDTDMITMDSYARETLLNALEEGNYVWVIPASSAHGNFQITVARGLPLSEDVKPYLTEAQQQQIRDNEGKWEITEVAMDMVSPYVDQLDTYASQLADCTRVIIAGGQTGFRMPVAEVQWSGDEKQQWGGLLPVAEKPQATWEEESAGHIQTVSWQQIAVPVLAVFLLAAVIILQKRKSC